jgi:hypothetical protein
MHNKGMIEMVGQGIDQRFHEIPLFGHHIDPNALLTQKIGHDRPDGGDVSQFQTSSEFALFAVLFRN